MGRGRSILWYVYSGHSDRLVLPKNFVILQYSWHDWHVFGLNSDQNLLLMSSGNSK